MNEDGGGVQYGCGKELQLRSFEPIFLQLNILPIDKLIQHRIELFIYKSFYELHPLTINNMYFKNCDVH